jgi:hypothetical protein
VVQRPALRVTAVAVVGGAIALGSLLAGLRGAVSSWPLATYPTFASDTSDVTDDLLYRAYTAGGEVTRGSLTKDAGLAPERAHGMTRSILEANEVTQRKMVAGLIDKLPATYRDIRVVRATVSLDPDENGRVLRVTPVDEGLPRASNAGG